MRQIAGDPIPRGPNSVGQVWDAEICASNKFPRDAVGPKTTLGEPLIILSNNTTRHNDKYIKSMQFLKDWTI